MKVSEDDGETFAHLSREARICIWIVADAEFRVTMPLASLAAHLQE